MTTVAEREHIPPPVHKKPSATARYFREVWRLAVETFVYWNSDNGSYLAAGLSYYIVFSLTPLLIIGTALIGLAFGNAAAEGVIAQQLGRFLGPSVAEAIQGLVMNAQNGGMGTASLIGTMALIYGASNIFSQLRVALNIIWDVRAKTEPVKFSKKMLTMALRWIISFAMVLGAGVMFLLFFFIDAVLGVLQKVAGDIFPIVGHMVLWKSLNFILSFVLLTAMSAAVYRFLPDTEIEWQDVWVGAAVTAFLIGLGRTAITLYFHYSNVASVYGVAGSLLIIFIGIYLSAQIFLLGAEFTGVYAHRHGSRS